MAEDDFQIASDRFGLYQQREEILGFIDFVAGRSPRFACEVGTWMCGTTFLLAKRLPSLSILIGVDRELQNEEPLRALAAPRLGLDLIEGLSTDPATLESVRAALDGNELDLLFVDGGHRYDIVRADFLAYRQLVRDGGLIAFHDIVPDYRCRFGATDGPWVGDVPQVWEKVKCGYESFEFVSDPDQNGYGIGVVVHEGGPLPPELDDL
jgi:cephalosporin hydroxylase